MKKIATIIGCFCIAVIGSAQTTNLGGPIGWKDKTESKNIPFETMPEYNQALIDAEDAINDPAKDAPWRFGYKHTVDLDLTNSGHWTDLPNGGRLWQLGIESPGAKTINLLIDDYNLPAGASLYLYDVDRYNRVGAYTQRNNRADGDLGTELVHGDKIIVEYYEPANVVGQGTLKITDVVHGYRSLNLIQDELTKDLQKSLNQSGDCNVDVNCPLGIGWEEQIRSVAMIVVNGSGICSGALINNTCEDGTPYFFTANHCYSGNSSNWAFRFNWESPPGTESCATTANSTDPGPPYDQTANGGTALVNGDQADYFLLQITNMTISDAQNWNCFYAGWDNSDALTVTQGTGIHHPSGDVKKMCRENNTPTQTQINFNGNPNTDMWKIADWDEGVTEPGSSGSPLFDQNGRIIGCLSGGYAACSGTNDNGTEDWYGRFAIAWANGVNTHLAPGGCGTTTTLDGFDPNAPSSPDDAAIQSIVDPTGLLCTGTINPIVTLKNNGTNNLTTVTINYDIDGGTNQTFAWAGTLIPGATVNVSLASMSTTSGNHTFNSSTTLPNGLTDSNPGNDGSSSTFSTMTNGQAITLALNIDCYGSEIDWLIQDAGSNTILSGSGYSDQSGGELITVNTCLDAGCYDFIINDSYGDGLYGSQYSGCSIDGNYTITQDGTANVLATLIAANSDFGNQEINNFCVASPCTGTVATTTTEELCFGDDSGTITVVVTGGTAPFTYDIGTGAVSSNVFTGLAQGSYLITVLDGAACSTPLNITLNGPSELIATATVTDELSGNDGEINISVTGGTGPFTYSWSGTGGFTSSSEDISGVTTGTYTVIITDANGCSFELTDIFVDSSVGILENGFSFSIYPNPSNGVYNVQLHNFDETVKVDVVDVTGRLVYSNQIINKTLFTIDISDKAKGTYFFRMRSDDYQIVKPIILK